MRSTRNAIMKNNILTNVGKKSNHEKTNRKKTSLDQRGVKRGEKHVTTHVEEEDSAK